MIDTAIFANGAILAGPSSAGSANGPLCSDGSGGTTFSTSGNIRTFLGLSTTDAVRHGTLALGTTATGQLTIGTTAVGYRTYQAIQFACEDQTGGSDFGMSITTVAGENGETRQHSQWSYGYNPSGPNVNSDDISFFWTTESWYDTGAVNQLEHYCVWSNPLTDPVGGYRPISLVISIDDNTSVWRFNTNSVIFQNRDDGTDNLAFSNYDDYVIFDLKKTSSIEFSGTTQSAITSKGSTLVFANQTRAGGGNLYRFSSGGSGVDNEVNFFGSGPSTDSLFNLIISVGTLTAGNNRQLRWNGTATRWEFELANSSFAAMTSTTATTAGSIPFGDGTLVTSKSDNLTWNNSTNALKVLGKINIGGDGTQPLYILDNAQSGFKLERTSAVARAYTQYIDTNGAWNLYDATAGAIRFTLSAGGLFGFDTGVDVLSAKVSVGGNLAAGTYRTAPSNGFAVSGSVGIGMTAPNAKLGVVGSIASSATPTDTVFSGTTGTNNASYIGPSGFWAIRSSVANAFCVDMYNGGSPLTALLIEQGGTLRFGTHSAIGAEAVTGFITIKDAGGTSRKLAVVSS